MCVRTTICERSDGESNVFSAHPTKQHIIYQAFSLSVSLPQNAMKTTFTASRDFSLSLSEGGSNEKKGVSGTILRDSCPEYIKISAEMQLGDRQIKKSCNFPARYPESDLQ